jgi:hypothetical protein
METLPYEIKQQEFYKHLSYDQLINLCQTNQEWRPLCANPQVWRFLLQRDFGMTTDANPKQMYLLYKHALDFLSHYYDFITLDALITFVTFIQPQDWSVLNDALLQQFDENFFSIGELIRLIQTTISNLSTIDFAHPFIIDGNINNLIISIEQTMPSLDEQLLHKIITKGCQQLKKYVSRQSFIFYKKQLKMVPYDYDFAETLEFNLYIQQGPQLECLQIVNEIKKIIMDITKI